MQKYHDTVQDTQGNAVTTASIYVYLAGTGTLASLKKDDEVTVLSNPITSADTDNYDSKGNFGFKAVNGIYDIKVVAADTTWKYERVLFDNNDDAIFGGNVGIGNTSLKNWHSSYAAVQVGGLGALTSYAVADTTSRVALGLNYYNDAAGSFKYNITDESSVYQQLGGAHYFQVAPSGTADATITYSNALVLDNSANATFGGNVSLGDSKYLYLGAGNDFRGVHTGTVSQLDNFTGNLEIRELVNSGVFDVWTYNSVGAGKLGIRVGGATPDVRLYYDGAVRLSTQSFGIDIADTVDPIINFDADDYIQYNQTNNIFSAVIGGAVKLQIDNTATAGQTALLIYDVDNATIERVTVGAADSGGAGYKVLRIPN